MNELLFPKKTLESDPPVYDMTLRGRRSKRKNARSAANGTETTTSFVTRARKIFGKHGASCWQNSRIMRTSARLFDTLAR